MIAMFGGAAFRVFAKARKLAGITIHDMSSRREDLRSKVRKVKGILNKIRRHLDDLQLYPRRRCKTDLVILTLLSKSLALSGSIVCLVQSGFGEEAFGLTRMEDRPR